jgi:hypothetical protein
VRRETLGIPGRRHELGRSYDWNWIVDYDWNWIVDQDGGRHRATA